MFTHFRVATILQKVFKPIRKIIISRHIQFDESLFPFVTGFGTPTNLGTNMSSWTLFPLFWEKARPYYFSLYWDTMTTHSSSLLPFISPLLDSPSPVHSTFHSPLPSLTLPSSHTCPTTPPNVASRSSIRNLPPKMCSPQTATHSLSTKDSLHFSSPSSDKSSPATLSSHPMTTRVKVRMFKLKVWPFVLAID